MMISADDLEFEVLRIFDKLRIPMGKSLSQTTLVKEWLEDQMRYDDLTQATQRLIKGEVLKKELTAGGGVQYQLTLNGFTRVMKMRQHQIRCWLQNIRIHALLALMRKSASEHDTRKRDF